MIKHDQKILRIFRTTLVWTLALTTSVVWAQAQKTQGASEKSPSSEGASQLKTTHSFDDYVVQGKFQLNEQTLITVEEDKALGGLIDVPKDFRARIKETR